MDPLSLTASLIAISQLTAVIVDYLGKVRNAPKERSQIAIEVSNIYHLLTTLRYRFEDGEFDEDWCQAISMLAAQNGPLNQYQQALESIKKKVEKSDRFSSFAASILWPFSKGELSELLSTIERLKTLVLVALETDHLKLSQTIKQTVDAIYNNNKIIMDDAYSIKKSLPALHSKVEEIDQHQLRDAILAWMSFQDYSVQHSDIMAKLPSACGVWFLQSEEFMGWLEGSNHTLFCPGIPGAGKTTTAAIAIDFLLKTAKDRSAAVAYVYCNYKSNSRQSALSIFGSLLKQLLRFCSTISESLLGQRKVSVRLSFDDILRELRFVLRESAVTYIVIDALDECLNDEGDVARLLVALRDLQGEGRFRLLCTSRFIPDIEAHFKADPRLEISARDVDVRHFVSCQIYRFPRCIQKDPELQQLVVKRIAETAGGMFLLARLYVDSLVDKRTKAKVRATLDRLSQMSQSIDEAYGEALERLDSQPFEDRSLAKRAISWIVCAQRPLTTDELRHALSVVPGQRELDMDDIVDAEDIVSVCAGLVTVDRESGIIRLVHHTAQEYFQRTRPIWSNLVQQDYFASICLTYLCFDYFADQTTAPDGATMMALYPFLSYTARYWGVHAQPAQETVTVLALRLLLNGTLVSLSAQAALIDSRAGHMEDDGGLDQQITNMHLMADFGLDLIIPQVISRQGTAALDALDRNGRSPLTCAAKNGHSAVVSLLLDHNVNIDAGDHLGRRPLSYAASGGHHIVVRLLLQHNDKADARDASGRTPLWWAAQNGSTAAAKELLSHGGVDVNAADPWTGQTPLLLAARGGFKEMVKLLLNQNDINPDVFDIKGRTALWYAAEQNHPEIAHILLENESVMKNARDIYGQTPLATAASRGNTATVALLLHYNKVDVKSRDIYGRAPLALAAENGHATVIEQLLARCDIEADCRDQDNWTPLHSAAFEGHRPVLEALLRHGVANINAASKGGLTPLSCANIRSPNDCVTMLLEHQKANKDKLRNSVAESHQATRITLQQTSRNQRDMKAVVSSWQVPPAFDLDNLVSRLLQAGRTGFERDCLPSEEEIRYLCIEARRVFLSETSLLELTAPIKICGDLRANFPALIRSFDMYGLPPESNYLFLGNYVNRGNQSIETICLLLALKIMHPGHIFLLRGRYETRDMSRLYGFYDEFSRANLHAGAWELFNECFDCLPIAATIEEKILAIPRGLSPDLYHMELIRRLWRPLEIPPYGLACDLLWATAEEDISGWSETENGVSFSFGPDIVARFVDKHDLDLICVSGHALEDGYEFYAGRKLVKLFTSPNYLGDFENAGAIMEVDETLLFTFKILKPSIHENK